MRLSAFTTLWSLLAALAITTSSAVSAEFSAMLSYGNLSAIIIHGPIISGDDARFQAIALQEIQRGHTVQEVRIFSPGGDVGAALRIGKQVRMLRAETIAPQKTRTGFGCNYSAADSFSSTTAHYGTDCSCESACSLIWMSGISRFGDMVGLHAPRYDEVTFQSLSTEEAQEKYQQVITQLKQYFNELGDIPPWTLQTILSRSSSNMHYLTPEEIRQFANFDPAIEELTIARCGAAPSGVTLFNSPARKAWYDCKTPVLEQFLAGGKRKYLVAYGGG
jgi:hypothetical protein